MTAKPKMGVAIYHVMFAHEDFNEAARALYAVVLRAATEMPGRPRHLFLDIDGHRNSEGGFDHDAYELQSRFVINMLLRYLTVAHVPVATIHNNKRQQDDMAEKLILRKAPQRRS